MPAGVALMAKLAMVPPVELMVKPVAAVLTVLVSDEEESVKAGATRVGVGAGASTLGAGSGGGGVSVVIDAEAVEGSDEPAKLLATIVNV
jgi:hypothetical protein